MVGYYFWIIRIHYDEWRSNIINIWITNRTSEAMKDNLKIVMVLYLFIHPYLWLDNQGDCCYLQQRFPNRYLCLFYWDCVICRMSYRLLLQLSVGLPFLTYKKVLTRVLLLPEPTLYSFCIVIIHSSPNCNKDLLNAIWLLFPKLLIPCSITFAIWPTLNAINFSISLNVNVKWI